MSDFSSKPRIKILTANLHLWTKCQKC